MVIRNSSGAEILLKCIVPEEFLLIQFRMGAAPPDIFTPRQVGIQSLALEVDPIV
jgi:hypothetical protein